MREDRAIVLGGFNPVEDFPGWVVRITSRRDREWIVAVELPEDGLQGWAADTLGEAAAWALLHLWEALGTGADPTPPRRTIRA